MGVKSYIHSIRPLDGLHKGELYNKHICRAAFGSYFADEAVSQNMPTNDWACAHKNKRKHFGVECSRMYIDRMR